MQQMLVEWPGRVGVEVGDSLRQRGETSRNATRGLQHEGRDLYEHHEERTRRTTAEAGMLMSEKRARAEAANHAFRRAELQVVSRLGGGTTGYANHESAAYRDHSHIAAKQKHDFMTTPCPPMRRT